MQNTSVSLTCKTKRSKSMFSSYTCHPQARTVGDWKSPNALVKAKLAWLFSSCAEMSSNMFLVYTRNSKNGKNWIPGKWKKLLFRFWLSFGFLKVHCRGFCLLKRYPMRSNRYLYFKNIIYYFIVRDAGFMTSYVHNRKQWLVSLNFNTTVPSAL